MLFTRTPTLTNARSRVSSTGKHLIGAGLAAAFALIGSAHASAAERIAPKVMVITMFGEETKPWLEARKLTTKIKVPGLSKDYPDVACDSEGLCVMTTAMGYANAASSTAALVLGGQFDLKQTYFLIDGIAGVLLIPLGMITASWQGMLINVAIGVLGGFVQVAVFTWIQQRVPRELLGRTMSLFMFIFMGLAPLAAVVAGWIASRVTLATLFAGSGLFLVGAALLAWLFTPMRTLRDAPAGTMV